MKTKASLTSLMSAFIRAYHAENSTAPIFKDTFARKLLLDQEYEEIADYIKNGKDFFAGNRNFKSESEALEWIVNIQLAPTPLARARYCEESLEVAVRTGTEQYVLLGAGLDTFAWRKSELMKKLKVFELDTPLTQEDKKERITRAGMPMQQLSLISIDFHSGNLREELLHNGFDETKKTFFSLLGVSYYLSPESIEKILCDISSFAAEGSTLLFDYADEKLFNAGEKRVQNMISMAQAAGEPMKFCTDENKLMMLLEKYHFLIYEHLTPDEIEARWYSGNPDGLTAFEHINYVMAVLKGTPFINTKEKILQHALRLFAQNGYEAVSVKDIADRLSITKGALYKHYASKRDIFDSIVFRMREKDTERARAYEVPENTLECGKEEYRRTQMENLLRYTEAQFNYWTEDPFASLFRKMLTVEQYRDKEMSALYQQYLCGGPLSYVKDILAEITEEAANSEAAEQSALNFYAPVFLLFELYDGDNDKAKATEMLRNHLNGFLAKQTRIKTEYADKE